MIQRHHSNRYAIGSSLHGRSPGVLTIAVMLAVMLAVLLTALFTAAIARAEIIPGMPDAIVCSVKDPTGVLPWERMVFYVSAQLRDGDTLYKSATSDPVLLKISEQGVINAANLADCDGRPVDELRKEGKAFNLTMTRASS
ncbi:MAG: hypothetical protein AAGI24_03080 [Pseudomonadota bacterium]